MNNKIIKHFLSSSIIYAFAAIITVKINEHIDIQRKKCEKNSKAVRYCHMLTDPYLPNTILFISTFLSSFILYLILYYLFNIQN